MFADMGFFICDGPQVLEEGDDVFTDRRWLSVVLPEPVSEAELLSLTNELAEEHRAPEEEGVFFLWRIRGQAPDEWWASSSQEGGMAEASIAPLSMEDFIRSVNSRPVPEEDELGLWSWEVPGYSPLLIHLIRKEGTVERRIKTLKFPPVEIIRETLTILSNNPLRIESRDENECFEYFEIDEEGELSGCDKEGPVFKYRRLR